MLVGILLWGIQRCKYLSRSLLILGMATLGVTIVECVVEIVDGLLDIVALLSSYLARLSHEDGC